MGTSKYLLQKQMVSMAFWAVLPPVLPLLQQQQRLQQVLPEKIPRLLLVNASPPALNCAAAQRGILQPLHLRHS